MADMKKYYYLKLKDNFFDSEEIKILESLPNGIYYSNLLIKLYLKSLKSDGALRFNDYIPYNEEMLAAITNLNIDVVRSGLKLLASLKLIERLEDGTIYMMNIHSLIGKSSSEADRKRIYREKIEEEKLLLGQLSDKCPEEAWTGNSECADNIRTNTGTIADKCPPEIELENRDKRIELELETDLSCVTQTEEDKDKVISETRSQSVSLLKSFEKQIGLTGALNLEALRRAVEIHGIENVKKAMDKALERNKPNMIYINGILRNWAKEGYPKEGEDNGIGYNRKNTGTSSKEFSGFKPREPRTLREEERAVLEYELV